MGTSGGRKRRITKDRVLDVMKEADHAFLTTTEIVDRLPASRQAVNNRLKELVERGELETRLSSNIRFYWLPGRVADGPDKRVVGDELVIDLDDRLREDLEKHAEAENTSAEEVTVDAVKEYLKEPPIRYWGAIRSLAFGIVIWFFVYAAAETYAPAIAVSGVGIIGGGLLVAFLLIFLVSILEPIVDPVVVWFQQLRE